MCRLAFAASLFSLAACSPGPHYYSNEVDMIPPMAHMSDIKQRGVFVMTRPEDNGPAGPVLCAEPSPDAMGAAAASMAAEANYKGEVSAGLSLAIAESVANVGLRTQSIQLLRDGMYRLCEAYQSGALGQQDYSIMQRRYQANMLALLAIEQLTGTVKPPTVALTSKSGSSLANEIVAGMKIKDAKVAEKNKLVAARDKAAADLKALEGQAETEETAAKKKELQNTIASNNASIANLDADIARLNRGMDGPSSLNASAETMDSVGADGQVAKPDEATIKAVADAVVHITDSITSADHSGSMCFEMLRRPAPNGGHNRALVKFCEGWFANLNEQVASETRRQNDCVNESLRLSKTRWKFPQIRVGRQIVPGMRMGPIPDWPLGMPGAQNPQDDGKFFKHPHSRRGISPKI
jgi:hypothetical protein